MLQYGAGRSTWLSCLIRLYLQCTVWGSYSGAGIGGLVLALVLRNSACSVELYESGNEITTVGAGITLFVRASEIMQHLGLLDELAGLAINPPLPNSGAHIAYALNHKIIDIRLPPATAGPRFRKGDQVGDNAWFEKILQSACSLFLLSTRGVMHLEISSG